MRSMIRVRSLLRNGAKLGVGGLATGVGAATVYACTDQGAGFRREVYFWSKVFPVVADYYFQTAESSPYVRYQKLSNTGLYEGNGGNQKKEGKNGNKNGRQDDDSATITREKFQEETRKQKRGDLINSLHEKHAPTILQVMLDLKGLYIKLGQVLSVTALPVPEAYRKLFRTLQNNVPGAEEFSSVVKPALEREFGANSLEELFDYVEPSPCGAASIGQAHRAKLKPSYDDKNGNIIYIAEEDRDVIIKVQYPDASWQVPADIQCVGDFLKICIWAGVVDGESAKMSFQEFSRQFLSELDYDRERQNLETVHESSLDPAAPYLKQGVVVPKVHRHLCTDKVITMEYLPGPTMESEAKRQLELLGIDTTGGIAQVIKNAAKNAADDPINNEEASGDLVRRMTNGVGVDSKLHNSLMSWKLSASAFLGRFVSFDSILWAIRTFKRVILLSQAAAVSAIAVLPSSLVSTKWETWADIHRTAAEEAERLGEIEGWCTALFDVHGHQIFDLGLFNADPHPGNILVIIESEEEGGRGRSPLGLIDYGQCKRLTNDEQVKIARLILSVANNEPDEVIAQGFRDMAIITKNDSTEFLAQFGKLMFGPFEPQHLSHKWHMQLHQKDKVLYFPKELSMVYRTSLLLRGLAVSLQLNYSIGEQWKNHAQRAVDRKNGLA